MPRATREDAALVVQLAQLYATSGASAATQWIWSENFVAEADAFAERYPPGSPEYDRIGIIASFFETVATLWKHELIDEALLFDWLGVALMWDRLHALLLAQREEAGDPSLWENFEAMAAAGARARVTAARAVAATAPSGED